AGGPVTQKLFFMLFCWTDRSLPSPSSAHCWSIACSNLILSNGSVQPGWKSVSNGADTRPTTGESGATTTGPAAQSVAKEAAMIVRIGSCFCCGLPNQNTLCVLADLFGCRDLFTYRPNNAPANSNARPRQRTKHLLAFHGLSCWSPVFKDKRRELWPKKDTVPQIVH